MSYESDEQAMYYALIEAESKLLLALRYMSRLRVASWQIEAIDQAKSTVFQTFYELNKR